MVHENPLQVRARLHVGQTPGLTVDSLQTVN